MIGVPPSFTLFPYRTLSRSRDGGVHVGVVGAAGDGAADDDGTGHGVGPPSIRHEWFGDRRSPQRATGRAGPAAVPASLPRSEEHTSELQSRQYIVCRLLLEK